MDTDRRLTGSVAGIFTTAVLALAVPGASAAGQTCDELRGNDLIKARTIVVVAQRSRTAGGSRRRTYIACGLPEGTLRPLKASRPGGQLELLDGEGAFLTVRDVATGRVDVVDVLSGRRRRVLPSGVNPIGRVVVGEAGEVAALVRVTGTTRLVGYDYDGRSYTLGEGAIPAASVRRKGVKVRWFAGGTPRTADLRAPQIPCAQLGGKEVRRSAVLRVVEFTYRSEYLEGELDGTTTRTRACLAAGGPVRFLGSGSFGSVEGGSSFGVEGDAGANVIGRSIITSSGAEFSSDQVVRYDLATGRRTPIWGNTDAGGPNVRLGSPLSPFFVTPGGQAGAIFSSEESSDETVVGFDPDGLPKTLDTAPAANLDERSLAIAGTVLRWTRDGGERTADLQGL